MILIEASQLGRFICIKVQSKTLNFLIGQFENKMGAQTESKNYIL